MLTHYHSSLATAELIQKTDTLAIVQYGDPQSKAAEPGIVHSGVRLLHDQDTKEVWQTSGTITRGESGRCQWSKTDELAFCAISLDELDTTDNLETATYEAYKEIISFLNAHALIAMRYWNFIPDINQGSSDLERYKLFCNGRLRAFEEMGVSPNDFPAASALGHYAKGSVIYVIAGKASPQHHANTMQVNAYEYPREYGPSSPSFARASSIELGQKPLFFISGTSSILGHHTVSMEDITGQTVTTIANIKHLIEMPECRIKEPETLRVYLRHSADLDAAKTIIQQEFPNTPTLYTHADVCRSNLLIEIEGHCG